MITMSSLEMKQKKKMKNPSFDVPKPSIRSKKNSTSSQKYINSE